MARSASNRNRRSADALDWLVGGGEMGERIRTFDWSRTALGAIATWPEHLRTTVATCVESRHPIVLYWGPEFLLLYNDAWAPVLGQKHPQGLGRSAREIWAEIWDPFGKMLESVPATGVATWCDDQLLLLNRFGFPEECYFSYSLSPVRDRHGEVAGVFTAVTETTRRFIGERRLRTLRELGERTLEPARTAEQACRVAADVLGHNDRDLPFAAIYLLEDDGRQARLVEAIGIAVGSPATPSRVLLGAGSDVWDFAAALAERKLGVRRDLQAAVGALPAGAWADDATRDAVVVPLARAGVHDLPAGFFVAGASPRLVLDEAYRDFLDLVAAQIATAIANARAYEEELERAEQLAALDRAKTAFFSNVSHEFRTPLTLMLGPLQDVLAAQGDVPTGFREPLAIAHRNALRLLKLVNTLLDFSRIESGRFQASYEPVQLATFTAELASTFRSAIERAGMRLVLECPELPEPIYVDRDMWEKIVLNLLSNAFKFTLQGEIRVRLVLRDGHAELAVTDTGTGIVESELPRVFERFHRVRDAQARSHEGSGIGLALVKELVNVHGGTVDATSRPGKGTTFTVRIPTGTAHLPQERLTAQRELASTALGARPFTEEASRWVSEERLAEAHPVRPPSMQPARQPKDPGTVLLADDNADMRDYVKRLLSDTYAVEAVANGKDALSAARGRAFDLVIADIMMPGLDGLQLLRALRADPRTSEIPIIMLSARAGEESKVEGLDAGADDYVVKPFTARELLARVKAHMSLAEERRRIRGELSERVSQLERANREVCDARRAALNVLEDALEARNHAEHLNRDLRESEARYRKLIETNTQAVWETTATGEVAVDSPSFRSYTGQTFDEWRGRGWLNAVHPEDRDAADRQWREAVAAGCDVNAEFRLKCAEGGFRWTNVRITPMLNADGSIRKWIGMGIDVQARRDAERAPR